MRALAAIVAVASLAAGASLAPLARGAEPSPPLLFVHGNGDSAALWITTVSRFESNGYDPARLFGIDFTHPGARADDTKPQDNRSSSDNALRELAAKVAEILARTEQKQVVLIGSSRGGNAIRNYVKFGGGAPSVSHAILGGTPNHGTQATNPNLNNEIHGAGPSEATQRFEPGPSRGVPVVLNTESMTVRTYPLEQGHVTVTEFHY
jgi:triacylglycerol esterase/lipase EstA (alpha/beta hydrolase family)